VRGNVRAADAPADLVELGEPEGVRPLDDQRVRLRNVEARLDDRRRDEDVGVAAQEAEHALLQVALAHLAVCHEHAQVRRQPFELGGRLVDRLDPVVQVERLAATRVLALERRADQVLVVLADVCSDRASALGRRLDDRDVAEAGERHVERARYRRRGQRQYVDLQAERAQQLLLLDAEALLLVDDDQAEVLRDDVARQHAVRADQDIHFAFGKVG
jgi:hypothetical protein